MKPRGNFIIRWYLIFGEKLAPNIEFKTLTKKTNIFDFKID